MTIRPILIWPDTRLTKPCVEVSTDVSALIEDLFHSLYAAAGRGLAAPQIGENLRVFVMDAGWKSGAGTPLACINPEISQIGAQARGEEACLSMPGVSALVPRATEIELSYTDQDGARQTTRLSGAEAIIAQHEADHLDGVMHFQHLPPQEQAALLTQYEAMS